MNPWPQDESQSWYRRLRRLWVETKYSARQSLAEMRAALRPAARALVQASNLSWIGGLRHRARAARSALLWTGHSLADWLAGIRGFPAFVRFTALRTAATIQFVRTHRTLRRLVLGLPALISPMVFAFVLSMYYQIDRAEFQARYRHEGDQAMRHQQWDAARVRYRRLAVETGDPPAVLYKLAQSLEGRGQTDRAEELFDRLAPEGATGFADAHVRKAKALLTKVPTPPDDRSSARSHLYRAVYAQPDSDEANAILGRLYFEDGDFLPAKNHLLKAVKKQPTLSITLAYVFLALSDRDQAQKWAREACNVFEARTVSDPDNVVSRIIWIRALLALDRHHEAQQALRAGLARNPADPNLLQMAREVYAVWAVSLRFDVEERYRLLEEGLKYVPDGGLLLLNLVDAAEESGPVGDSARALIQRLEADPRCAPGVYLSRGIRAFREDPDDVDTAIGHLEKAFQLAPDSPDIANNLAMLLLKRPSPDLPRALDTVNIALKALPNEPTYRDTRGHIYVRQGRWQEAVDDLDFAIPHLKVAADRRETHRALAEAHRQLNHPGQAAHHERLAQAIK